MDHGRRLWRGVAVVDRPRAHLLFASGEIRLEAEQLVARANKTVESSRLESERPQKISAIFRRQLRQLGLDLRGKRNDVSLLTTFPDRVAQSAQVRTLFARKLGVADVGGVQHGFDRQ